MEEENLTTASKAYLAGDLNVGNNTSLGEITEKQFAEQIVTNDEAFLIH